jgi:hypothetical protein
LRFSTRSKVTGLAGKLSNSIEIKTPILGSAIVRATLEGKASLSNVGKDEVLAGHKAWVLGNADAIKVGST